MTTVAMAHRPLRMRVDDGPITQTVDRLCTEFGDRSTREGISSVVYGCVIDLAGSPLGAMPELCERLARRRLVDAENSAAPWLAHVVPGGRTTTVT
ncbi:hypothetical protein OG225_16905 [Nocardia sp. NBC_01377]|uniref:hypothetical protein n=1 Tax=Nocardia sp. NBC_01377 TaxID=2903595 RepID=UPI003245A794